jgi:hypothetical protein
MSDDNVIRFPNADPDITYGTIPPERVLSAALEDAETFESVMLLGWKKDGGLFIGSTDGYVPDNLALLEIVKQEYLRMMVGDYD